MSHDGSPSRTGSSKFIIYFLCNQAKTWVFIQHYEMCTFRLHGELFTNSTVKALLCPIKYMCLHCLIVINFSYCHLSNILPFLLWDSKEDYLRENRAECLSPSKWPGFSLPALTKLGLWAMHRICLSWQLLWDPWVISPLLRHSVILWPRDEGSLILNCEGQSHASSHMLSCQSSAPSYFKTGLQPFVPSTFTSWFQQPGSCIGVPEIQWENLFPFVLLEKSPKSQ